MCNFHLDPRAKNGHLLVNRNEWMKIARPYTSCNCMPKDRPSLFVITVRDRGEQFRSFSASHNSHAEQNAISTNESERFAASPSYVTLNFPFLILLLTLFCRNKAHYLLVVLALVPLASARAQGEVTEFTDEVISEAAEIDRQIFH